MTQELSTTANQIDTKTIEQVLIGGNLASLTTEQRTAYYASVCKSIGLNPLTKPFDYITLNGKLTLYARKDATEQLRRQHNLSIKIVGREKVDDIYIVTAQATMPDGRCDESTGAVSVMGLKGEALANCYMKAETKAKRRVTLSICGLGMLDESEVESIDGEDPTKRPVRKDNGNAEGTVGNGGSGNTTTSSKLNQAVTGTSTKSATSTNQTGNTPDAGIDREEAIDAEITSPVKNDENPTGESKSGATTVGTGKTDRKAGGKAKPESVTGKPDATPTVQPEQVAKDTIKAQLFEQVVSKKESDGRIRFGCKAGGVYYGTYSGEIADRVQHAVTNRHLMNITYNIRSENDITKRDIISIEQSDLDDVPPIA